MVVTGKFRRAPDPACSYFTVANSQTNNECAKRRSVCIALLVIRDLYSKLSVVVLAGDLHKAVERVTSGVRLVGLTCVFNAHDRRVQLSFTCPGAVLCPDAFAALHAPFRLSCHPSALLFSHSSWTSPALIHQCFEVKKKLDVLPQTLPCGQNRRQYGADGRLEDVPMDQTDTDFSIWELFMTLLFIAPISPSNGLSAPTESTCRRSCAR